MKTLLNTLIIILLPFITHAQFGELRGTVTSSLDGLPLPGATVTYYYNGVLQGVSADSAGRYKIKPLVPGTYDIRISFVTFKTVSLTGIIVNTDKITYANANLEPDNNLPIVDIPYQRPLIDIGNASTVDIIDAEEIEQSMYQEVEDLVATTATVYQPDDGGSLNVRGSREDATQYIVDGIKVVGPFSLPKSAIAEITVITGGVPAQYGDATGGIIVITTKRYVPVNR
jgi:hypothetical protein